MSTPTTKTLTLRSNDGEQFEVEEAAAMVSQTLKGMIEDDCADNIIPVNNITGSILAKVIEYCRKHVAGADTDEGLKKWDEEFVKVDMPVVFDLLLAANYLDIKGLLDLGTQTIANFIKDKSVEEVRDIFNIVNDFTKEEEDAIRAENAWAFE